MKKILVIIFIILEINSVFSQDIKELNLDEIMRNGLHKKLKGEWINTSLFDSTLYHNKLQPWLTEFYGDLILTITESDTVTIMGNMDGGRGKVSIIDSLSFSILARGDNPSYCYINNKDLIVSLTGLKKQILYRRIIKSDSLNIIRNRENFNNYFINHFFKDFFQETEQPNIVYIWNGFRTHTPYKFDAIKIKDKNGKIEDYAWKISGDTLQLFKTSKYYSDDMFPKYKIEELSKIYIKNNKSR